MPNRYNPLDELIDSITEGVVDTVTDAIDRMLYQRSPRPASQPQQTRQTRLRKSRPKARSKDKIEGELGRNPPRPPIPDLYAVLEVSPHASQETIAAAYRSLAVRFHPDRHPGNKPAEFRMRAINAAYQTLKDPTKRAEYDRKAGLK